MQPSPIIARLVAPVLATVGSGITRQFTVFIAGALIANDGFFIGAGTVLLGVGGFIAFKGYMV